MLVIRLARVGKKNHATFRVIVSEKTKDTRGDFLELLGSYDPHQSPAKAVLNAERVSYWISKGAQPSGSVHNILIDQKIITGEKIRVANIRKKVEEKKADTPAAVAPIAKEEPVAEKPAEAPVVEEKPVEEKPAPEVKAEAAVESKKEDKKEEKPVEPKAETPAA